jgi:two-component system sensor histidine kinase HydH
MGELVGSVLHELRNPLGVIESSLYLIRQKPDDAPRRDKHLERIGEQVKRAQLVITGLMSLLHDHPLDLQPVDVASIVADVRKTLTLRVPLRLELDAAPPVRGEASLLRQVMHNLLDNAQREARSWVSVAARLDGDRVAITIEDDGPGVPEVMLPSLFQPLATGRPDGTGLGLALCKRIAERHGGSLRHDGGSRFVLTLPAAS